MFDSLRMVQTDGPIANQRRQYRSRHRLIGRFSDFLGKNHADSANEQAENCQVFDDFDAFAL